MKTGHIVGLLLAGAISLIAFFLYVWSAWKKDHAFSNGELEEDEAREILKEAVKRANKVIEDAKVGGAWW